MVDDFYVKFSNASRYEDEGNMHVRLTEPRERVEVLLPLLYELMRSDTKPNDIQSCPICHQALEVSFARYPLSQKPLVSGQSVKPVTSSFCSNQIRFPPGFLSMVPYLTKLE